MDWKEWLLQWWYKLWYRVPKWDKCTKASCWSGHNASKRMMNILSPHMPDNVFRSRVKWMKARGCNTADVFVSNEKDGEYAGYSPYGPKWDWQIDETDEKICRMMRERIRYMRRKGLAVVVWLLADDGPNFNSMVDDDFDRYVRDCKEQGFFDLASTVVAGLELGDYFNHAQVAAEVAAIRKYYRGMVGIHQNAGRTEFAALGDLFFGQASPGHSADWLIGEAHRMKNATQKPVNMFEIERQEARDKCVALLADGVVFGVGNW